MAIDTLKAIKYAKNHIDNINLSINKEAGVICSEMAEYYYYNVEYIKALKYGHKGYVYLDSLSHSSLLAHNCLYLAKTYRRIGYPNKALKYAQKSLEYYTEFNNQKYIGRVYNLLGGIYKDLDENDKALLWYKKYYNISYQNGFFKNEVIALNNIGVLYGNKRKYALARANYHNCININKLHNRDYKSGIYYSNIGNNYLNEKKYELAKPFLMKGLKLNILDHDLKGTANTYMHIGNFYYEIDSLSISENYYNKALNILDNSGANTILVEIYSSLQKIYKKMGNYSKAYEALNTYQILNDKLKDQSIIKDLAYIEWNAGYKKEKEIASFHKERFILISLLFMILLILIIVILFFLNKKQKLKLCHRDLENDNQLLQEAKIKNELELKNKELIINSMNKVKNKEINKLVIQKLKLIKQNSKPDNKKELQILISKLNFENDSDNKWKEFEGHFLNVNKSFYDNLLKEFPKLSVNEKRLSAFIKMNLSSKEISNITGQSIHSINIARARMRKKFNINGNNIPLTEFLQKY
ncbi:MAG: tetratricopeptide repeat protein [Bacteroidales bacterium]